MSEYCGCFMVHKFYHWLEVGFTVDNISQSSEIHQNLKSKSAILYEATYYFNKKSCQKKRISGKFRIDLQRLKKSNGHYELQGAVITEFGSVEIKLVFSQQQIKNLNDGFRKMGIGCGKSHESKALYSCYNSKPILAGLMMPK